MIVKLLIFIYFCISIFNSAAYGFVKPEEGDLLIFNNLILQITTKSLYYSLMILFFINILRMYYCGRFSSDNGASPHNPITKKYKTTRKNANVCD